MFFKGNAKESSKNKRKSVWFAPEDVVDKSVGYDLTDTFIDDSQAVRRSFQSFFKRFKGNHLIIVYRFIFSQLFSYFVLKKLIPWTMKLYEFNHKRIN